MLCMWLKIRRNDRLFFKNAVMKPWNPYKQKTSVSSQPNVSSLSRTCFKKLEWTYRDRSTVDSFFWFCILRNGPLTATERKSFILLLWQDISLITVYNVTAFPSGIPRKLHKNYLIHIRSTVLHCFLNILSFSHEVFTLTFHVGNAES